MNFLKTFSMLVECVLVVTVNVLSWTFTDEAAVAAMNNLCLISFVIIQMIIKFNIRE